MADINTLGIQWGYGIQSTNFSTAVAATAGLRVRDEGGLSNFDPGMTPAEAKIQAAKWGARDFERRAGIYRPTWSLPGLCSPGLMKLFLDATLKPTVAGSGFTYDPFSDTTCSPDGTKHLTLWRRNTKATAKDEKLTGAVSKVLKISSSQEQQNVNLDVDFLAYDFDDAQTGSAGVYTLPAADDWLLHSGATFKIGAGAIAVVDFDFSIDFGIVAHLDNAANPRAFTLGEIKVEGSVKTPWIDDDVLADFEGQTSNTLTFLWGTAASSGYLEIIVPVKYNRPTSEKGDERMDQSIPFVYSATSSQQLQIKLQV